MRGGAAAPRVGEHPPDLEAAQVLAALVNHQFDHRVLHLAKATLSSLRREHLLSAKLGRGEVAGAGMSGAGNNT